MVVPVDADVSVAFMPDFAFYRPVRAPECIANRVKTKRKKEIDGLKSQTGLKKRTSLNHAVCCKGTRQISHHEDDMLCMYAPHKDDSHEIPRRRWVVDMLLEETSKISSECQLCATAKEPTNLQHHYMEHWKSSSNIEFEDGSKLLKCLRLSHRNRPHYHCPECRNVTVINRSQIVHHIEKHNLPPVRGTSTKNAGSSGYEYARPSKDNADPSNDEPSPQDSSPQDPSPQDPSAQDSSPQDPSAQEPPQEPSQGPPPQRVFQGQNTATIKCHICSRTILKTSLTKHLKSHNVQSDIYVATCVDIVRGLYLVNHGKSGTQKPIHVKKQIFGEHFGVQCSSAECEAAYAAMIGGSQPGWDCRHIKAISSCPPYEEPDQLDEEHLTALQEEHIINERSVAEALEVYHSTPEPAVVPYQKKTASSEKESFYSVKTKEYKAVRGGVFGRVVVTFSEGSVRCNCTREHQRRWCPHKTLCLWHLKQHNEELLKEFDTNEVDDDENEESSRQQLLYPPRGEDLTNIVSYIHSNKKIPNVCPERFKESDDKSFVPLEENCVCNGPLTKELLVTRKAKVLLPDRVLTGYSVFVKRCTSCNLWFRYQEISRGLVNFNDHLLVSVQLCEEMRVGLQKSIPVSANPSVVKTMKTCDVYPPLQDVTNAFQLYLGLLQTEYSFFCVKCGFYPPILEIDACKKTVTDMLITDLQPLSEQEIKGLDAIDMEKFWTDREMESIARGFLRSSDENPYKLEPGYTWAPWVCPNNKKASGVVNTEIMKCPSQHRVNLAEVDDPTELDNITGEILTDMLDKKDLRYVKNLCRTLGINTNNLGGKKDIIVAIWNTLKDNTMYQKVFKKIHGSTGGFVIAACPHQIVYGLKHIVRSEGPRDHMDLLFSLQHAPNVVINDMAHMVAVHGNLRCANFFSPCNGRVTEATEENIRSAEAGRLEVSFPWLDIRNQLHRRTQSAAHPVTNINDRLCLVDKFHQSNTKKREEVLRRIDIVKELKFQVNSQAQEQLFSQLRRNNHFLNMMSCGAHLLTNRVIINDSNMDKNEKTMKDLQKRLQCPVALSDLGKVVSNKKDNQRKSAAPSVPPPEAHVPPRFFSNTGNGDHWKPSNRIMASLDRLINRLTHEETDYLLDLKHLLVDMKDTYRNTYNELSFHQIQNLKANIKYIEEVIHHARPQVIMESVKRESIRMQVQGPHPLCGLAAANNAMDDDGNSITSDEMFDAADELYVRQAMSSGLLSNLLAMRTYDGNFNISVVEQCLMQHGYTLRWIQDSIFSAMNNETIGNIIQNLIHNKEKLSILLKQSGRDHYVVVKYIRPNFWYLDSLSITIRQLNQGQLELLFVAEKNRGDSAIIVVSKASDYRHDQSGGFPPPKMEDFHTMEEPRDYQHDQSAGLPPPTMEDPRDGRRDQSGGLPSPKMEGSHTTEDPRDGRRDQSGGLPPPKMEGFHTTKDPRDGRRDQSGGLPPPKMEGFHTTEDPRDQSGGFPPPKMEGFHTTEDPEMEGFHTTEHPQQGRCDQSGGLPPPKMEGFHPTEDPQDGRRDQSGGFPPPKMEGFHTTEDPKMEGFHTTEHPQHGRCDQSGGLPPPKMEGFHPTEDPRDGRRDQSGGLPPPKMESFHTMEDPHDDRHDQSGDLPSPKMEGFYTTERRNEEKSFIDISDDNDEDWIKNLVVPEDFTQFCNTEWKDTEMPFTLVAKEGIQITVHDLLTLREGEYINDNIINFALAQLATDSPQCFVLPSHLFIDFAKGKLQPSKHVRKTHSARYLKYIFPVHESSHWFLSVVDMSDYTYAEFDSLKMKRDESVRNWIATFLGHLHVKNVTKLSKKKGHFVARQSCKPDCGCYLVMHAVFNMFPQITVWQKGFNEAMKDFRKILGSFILQLHHKKDNDDTMDTLLNKIVRRFCYSQREQPYGLRGITKKPKMDFHSDETETLCMECKWRVTPYSESSVRCGCCAVFYHKSCVGVTTSVFVCNFCLESDPCAIPLIKNEEDILEATSPQRILTLEELLQKHDVFTWARNFKDSPLYKVAEEVAHYINYKCLPDFGDPLPNVIIRLYTQSDKPMYGCYLPHKHFTVICLDHDLDIAKMVGVLIHEMGHALQFIISSVCQPPHGRSWKKHTKDIFTSVMLRLDAMAAICQQEIDLAGMSNLIFTATK